jgi:hypothetical protein
MSYARYKTNPFLQNMIVPIKEKRIKLSVLGNDNNILINQDTGEINGTHIATFKKVDRKQFVKLFTSNIAMTFDLSSSGIKTFTVLVWSVQKKALCKDEVDLDGITLDEFIEEHKEKKLKLSLSTFKRGINELEKAMIIAKTMRQGRYFINPNFVFNGDRIVFSTIIEEEKSKNRDYKIE